MIQQTPFLNIYLAPILIFLAIVAKKNLLFSLAIGLLGIWECAQFVIPVKYFYPIEAFLMGFSSFAILSFALEKKIKAQHAKKVLIKLPLLGAMIFLTLYNFLSTESFQVLFFAVILASLGLNFRKNIISYLLALFFILAMIFQILGWINVFAVLGLGLLILKLPSMEEPNA